MSFQTIFGRAQRLKAGFATRSFLLRKGPCGTSTQGPFLTIDFIGVVPLELTKPIPVRIPDMHLRTK